MRSSLEQHVTEPHYPIHQGLPSGLQLLVGKVEAKPRDWWEHYYNREKKGYRSTTMTSDYDMEITVKDIKRQCLLQPQGHRDYRLTMSGDHHSTAWLTTARATYYSPDEKKTEAATTCGVKTAQLQVHYHNVARWLQQIHNYRHGWD